MTDNGMASAGDGYCYLHGSFFPCIVCNIPYTPSPPFRTAINPYVPLGPIPPDEQRIWVERRIREIVQEELAKWKKNYLPES